MYAKKMFSISISAIITAIAGILLSFLFLFAVFYVDKIRVEVLDGFWDAPLSLMQIIMIFLSGVLFIIAELASGIAMKKAKILQKKAAKIALILGAAIYALLMIFLFPYSLDALFAYLPRRELAPEITVFIFQLSSCAAALICVLFNLVPLFRGKKPSETSLQWNGIEKNVMERQEKSSMKKKVRITALCIAIFAFIFIFGHDIAVFCVWESEMLKVMVRDLFANDPHGFNADDVISEAVYQEIGGGEIHYQGKVITQDGVISYAYLFTVERQGQLGELVAVVNKVIQQEDINDKIRITGWYDHGSGAGFMFSISNCSDEKLGKADYKTLKQCYICGGNYYMTIYNDPAAYSDLSGIVDLTVKGYMAELTEREGIDWYEYFPELEKLEVVLPDGE